MHGTAEIVKLYYFSEPLTILYFSFFFFFQSCEGNEKMVKHLLAYGVSVHVRDRHDRTALMEAIAIDNHEIIKILIKCGAHMTGS